MSHAATVAPEREPLRIRAARRLRKIKDGAKRALSGLWRRVKAGGGKTTTVARKTVHGAVLGSLWVLRLPLQVVNFAARLISLAVVGAFMAVAGVTLVALTLWHWLTWPFRYVQDFLTYRIHKSDFVSFKQFRNSQPESVWGQAMDLVETIRTPEEDQYLDEHRSFWEYEYDADFHPLGEDDDFGNVFLTRNEESLDNPVKIKVEVFTGKEDLKNDRPYRATLFKRWDEALTYSVPEESEDYHPIYRFTEITETIESEMNRAREVVEDLLGPTEEINDQGQPVYHDTGTGWPEQEEKHVYPAIPDTPSVSEAEPVVLDMTNFPDLTNPRDHDWGQYLDQPEVADAFDFFANQAKIAGDKNEFSYWSGRAYARRNGTRLGWSNTKITALFLNSSDKQEVVARAARQGVRDEHHLMEEMKQRFTKAAAH